MVQAISKDKETPKQLSIDELATSLLNEEGSAGILARNYLEAKQSFKEFTDAG